jgi:hypothetical protein
MAFFFFVWFSVAKVYRCPWLQEFQRIQNIWVARGGRQLAASSEILAATRKPEKERQKKKTISLCLRLSSCS